MNELPKSCSVPRLRAVTEVKPAPAPRLCFPPHRNFPVLLSPRSCLAPPPGPWLGWSLFYSSGRNECGITVNSPASRCRCCSGYTPCCSGGGTVFWSLISCLEQTALSLFYPLNPIFTHPFPPPRHKHKYFVLNLELKLRKQVWYFLKYILLSFQLWYLLINQEQLKK